MKEIVKYCARTLCEWLITTLLIAICLNFGFALYKLSEWLWGL